MESLLFAFLTSFMVTVFFTPSLILVAKLKNLHDEPSERKLHKRRTPTIGGIMIFASTIFAYALWYPSKDILEFNYVIVATLTLFFVGIKDDIIGTAPIKKLMANILIAMCIVLMADIRIRSLHGIFNIFDIPLWASIFLSIFTIIVIINAFNLIDGVDGLAGSLGLLATLLFGTYFYAVGLTAYALFAFAMSASLVAFLYFNFNPAKIFMGDSGSLLLGLVNAILVLKFISVGDAATVAFPIASVVPVGFAILMVPLAVKVSAPTVELVSASAVAKLERAKSISSVPLWTLTGSMLRPSLRTSCAVLSARRKLALGSAEASTAPSPALLR